VGVGTTGVVVELVEAVGTLADDFGALRDELAGVDDEDSVDAAVDEGAND
jgi:hypothetical protein